MDISSVNVAKGKPRYIGASKLLCNNKTVNSDDGLCGFLLLIFHLCSDVQFGD